MSKHQTNDKRGSTWRARLRRIIGLVGLAGLSSAAMASAPATDKALKPAIEPLEQRVEAVRQALAKSARPVVSAPLTEEAQWSNWNNWSNWRNWGNV